MLDGWADGIGGWCEWMICGVSVVGSLVCEDIDDFGWV